MLLKRVWSRDQASFVKYLMHALAPLPSLAGNAAFEEQPCRAVGEHSCLKSNKSQTQRSIVPCVTFVQDSTRLGLRGENWVKKAAPLRLGAPQTQHS